MLVAEHITKRFGSLTALDNISIDFLPGEIHAVLGENGAGKSTLMSVLSGFMTPQQGTVTLDGKKLPSGHPRSYREAGIEMVHQHFRLVPAFTIAENLALARLDRLAKPLSVDQLAAPAVELAKELGWDLDPRTRVRNLPVGVQQRIEILKCLSGNAQVIIFDEPTAVLSPEEVGELFRVLRELKGKGKTVILIAHKLSEVMAVADRVTVLRRGQNVATALIGAVDAEKLAEWMVGEMPELGKPHPLTGTREGLRVRDLTVLGDRGEEAVRSVSLEVGQGEILGIGGVDGNGQVELAEALAKVRHPKSGSLHWLSGDSPPDHVGIAYIPQDRQEDGLALAMSVADNLLISGHRKQDLTSGFFLSSQKVRAWVQSVIRRFEIRVQSPSDPVSTLSGGNQQKVVVGRSLDRNPQLLVAVNPTRGLDVRATQFVYDQILQARAQGTAVALFSTDLDELAFLADRTLFMSGGRLVEGGAVALVGGSS